MDTLSLLSVSQHVDLAVSLLALYLFAFLLRVRFTPKNVRGRAELFRLLKFIGMIALVDIAIALLPRPMLMLSLRDPDKIAVDFHSHTNRSHDGRPGFTSSVNEQWHSNAGFNAAYVSDHRKSFALTSLGIPPANAATRILPAFEARVGPSHVVVLGMPEKAGTDAERDLTDMLGRQIALRSMSDSVDYQMILTLPDPVGRTSNPRVYSSPHLTAVEISDGSPRGLEQGDRDQRLIVDFANARNLAIVAGSNNHGWGFTAHAWNVMRVPAWRTMSRAALDSAIRAILYRDRAHAVSVVERNRVPTATSLAGKVALIPLLVWEMLVTLSNGERVVWPAWVLRLGAFAELNETRRGKPIPGSWRRYREPLLSRAVRTKTS